MLTIPLGADASGVLTKDDLENAANPQLLNQLEAIPQPLYDTRISRMATTARFRSSPSPAERSVAVQPGEPRAARGRQLLHPAVHLSDLAAGAGHDGSTPGSGQPQGHFGFLHHEPADRLAVRLQKEYGPWPALMAGADGGISGGDGGRGCDGGGSDLGGPAQRDPRRERPAFGGSVVLTPRKQFSVQSISSKAER